MMGVLEPYSSGIVDLALDPILKQNGNWNRTF
jgi:hypothetical protein